MADLFKPIKKKVNNTIIHFVINGLLLAIMGALIAWSNFMTRLLVSAVVIAIAFMFFYLAYRIYSIKSDIEKYFKI